MSLTIVKAREGDLACEDFPHEDTKRVNVTRGAQPTQPQQLRRPAAAAAAAAAASGHKRYQPHGNEHCKN
jgi:hypothetical protein